MAYQYTIASTSNWLTANVVSPFNCPSHSKRLLWLHRPMHHSTHKPLYLSQFYSPKSSKIYRCWIVWGQNIRVVIIPSLLAIAYLGQSFFLYLLSRFQFFASQVTWLAPDGAIKFVQGHMLGVAWGNTVVLTCLVLSMAVNTLVTVLIVFKILQVFLEVKATMTSVERTLGSTGGTKLRHIIFIIIESGMALFSIQLVRVVLSILAVQGMLSHNSQISSYFIIGIHQMFNVIIRSIFFLLFFVLLITFTWLGHHTNNNFGAGLNETVLWRQRILHGNCRKSLF